MSPEITPEQVGEYLQDITPSVYNTGRIPYPIFMAERTHLPTQVVEIVLFAKEKDGTTSLALARRPMEDPVWPGRIGLTGAQVTAKDINPGMWAQQNNPHKRWATQLNRLRTKELDNSNVKLDYVGNFPVTSAHKGVLYCEMAATFVGVLNGREIKNGIEYLPLDKKPEGMIDHHIPLIVASGVHANIFKAPIWYNPDKK